ncbi:MAG: DUF3566 domain-containing protein [Microbacteriaceae bacterium]|jgi:hypothetical protein|nr:DUF3566 domain-containing protein [Microbacteriaceae bacterium]
MTTTKMSGTAQKLASKSSRGGQSRRMVDLQISHISVWSATRISFLVALGFSLAGVILSFLLWILVSQLGVFNALNDLLSTTASGSSSSSVDIAKVFSLPRILGFSVLGGIVNLVFGTLLGTVSSWLYNICVKLVGGIELHFTNSR